MGLDRSGRGAFLPRRTGQAALAPRASALFDDGDDDDDAVDGGGGTA